MFDLYDKRQFAKAESFIDALLEKAKQSGDSSELIWLVQACGMARLDPRKYSESELDDIELNTMEAVFKGYRTYNGSGTFRGWVRTLAKNESYQLIQAKQGQRVRATMEIERRIERSFRFSSLVAGKGDLDTALKLLKPDHREVVLAWLRNDRNAAKTAKALDKPANTVKSRLYVALDELQAILESPGYHYGK